MMKPVSLMFFLLLVLLKVNGQDVYFEWAKQLDRRTGLSFDEGYFVGVDNDRNVYLVGNYRNTIDLDPGPGDFSVTSQWDHVFVIKLDPAGNFIWGKDIGGDRFTLARSVTVDPSGNIYITGGFSGTTDFNPGSATFALTAATGPGSENYDIFTLKLDRDGAFQWAVRAGDLGPDNGLSITVDLFGNVYTTGSNAGRVDFNPGDGEMFLGANTMRNNFITKFSSKGAFIWAKEFEGNSTSNGTCIRTDRFGNVYATGIFEGTVDFDPGAGIYSLTVPHYSKTPYLCKLDGDGNFLWVKQDVGGQFFEVNANEELITYSSTYSFNGNVSKYNPEGNLVWSKVMGGRPSLGYAGNSPIRLDAAGNIFITGEFNYTQDFDPGPGVYNMTAMGGGYNYDAFICRFDAEGQLVWAKQFGNYSEEHPMSMVLDTAGNIYTSGTYWGTVDFDPGPGKFELTAFSGGGAFIQKLSRCAGVTYASLDVKTCYNYTLNHITYNRSGIFTQTLPNQQGCDSIITLNLEIQNNQTRVKATACDLYTWNNQTYNQSGIYWQSFTTAAGCDSTVELELTLQHKAVTEVLSVICEGSAVDGYRTSGTYTDIFVAANGCDSIRTLHLTVQPVPRSTINLTLCAGGSYDGYSRSGTYIDTVAASNGCDSIRTLVLKVNPVYLFSVKQTICRGEAYMGHRQSGTFRDTLRSAEGCDSIQITQLTVLEPPSVNLGRDTILCLRDSLVLVGAKGQQNVWQDGSGGEYFVVRKPGRYFVKATNSCGSSADEVVIGERSCTVYFATAFTPNRDGINDAFGILNGYQVAQYHLVIYDRWGNIIFESRQPTKKWDGTFKGQPLQSGLFIWQAVFYENGIKQMQKGTVTLIL